MVSGFYELFLDHVARGRNMTRDQVNAVAQGESGRGPRQDRARGCWAI